MTVAQTILNQLGGNKFVVMTGSKNFTSDGNTLKMNLAKNRSKANHLKITLNAMDTYDMEFIQYIPYKFNIKTGESRNEKIFTVVKFDGVYCDRLQSLFTETTGLDTRL